MLADALMKIEKERKAFQAGSLEAGIAEMLLNLCKQDPAVVAVIAATDKAIKDCSKHLFDHAKKNKQGNVYAMLPAEAEKLIRGFYGVASGAKTEAPAVPQNAGNINILDLLE